MTFRGSFLFYPTITSATESFRCTQGIPPPVLTCAATDGPTATTHSSELTLIGEQLSILKTELPEQIYSDFLALTWPHKPAYKYTTPAPPYSSLHTHTHTKLYLATLMTGHTYSCSAETVRTCLQRYYSLVEQAYKMINLHKIVNLFFFHFQKQNIPHHHSNN